MTTRLNSSSKKRNIVEYLRKNSDFVAVFIVVTKMEGGPSIQERESQVSQEIINDEHEDRSCSYFCCHPLGTGHRFVALFFMCFLGFGE